MRQDSKYCPSKTIENLRNLVCEAFVTNALVSISEIVVVARVDEALVIESGADLDVILIGAGLPNTRSIEATKSLNVRYPGTPIIILARENDRAFATQAAESGACACLGGDEVTAPLLQRVARFAVERSGGLMSCNLRKSGKTRFRNLERFASQPT